MNCRSCNQRVRVVHPNKKECHKCISWKIVEGEIKMFDLDELIKVQTTTNDTLQELLDNVKRSNKILMMVNIVNIATIITLLVVVL